MKWMVWFFFVGIFYEDVDILRKGIYLVEDLAEFGWKHFDIPTQRKFASAYQDKFPLRLPMALIINPPFVINNAIADVYSKDVFLKSKMLERFKVIDSTQLVNYIDLDELAVEFGGNMKLCIIMCY